MNEIIIILALCCATGFSYPVMRDKFDNSMAGAMLTVAFGISVFIATPILAIASTM